MKSRLIFCVPFLALSLSSCGADEGALPVEYGPAVPVSDIQKAIISGVQDIDTTKMKLGAAVQYTTTQSIAGGQIVNLMGVTTLTIVDRAVVPSKKKSGNSVSFTLNERKRTFNSGQKPTDIDRDFQLTFDASPGDTSSQAVPVTFHKLRTSRVRIAAPKAVAAKPNCMGLPDCMMTYNNVSFDQVAWRPEGAEKIHFDFSVSPDLPQISGFNMSPLFPFYQGLAKSCVTLLVPVGDGHEKTLLMECQQVRDFRFEQRAP